VWRRQIMRARHLRHSWWGWPVAASHGQDLRRSSTKAAMRLGCTGGSFYWVRAPPGGRNSLSCIAGCAAVSGRGYYATGPALDVPGRLRWDEAVLACPADSDETPHSCPKPEAQTILMARGPATATTYPPSRSQLALGPPSACLPPAASARRHLFADICGTRNRLATPWSLARRRSAVAGVNIVSTAR
jgi:hypothetical protein